MKSVFFWTCFVIGFVAVVLLHRQQTNVNKIGTIESFTTAQSTIVPYYEGPNIPSRLTQNNLIFAYLSSFSDVMPDGKTPVYTAGGSAYWRDLQNGTDIFNIVGQGLPQSLRDSPTKSLPMNGVQIIGPPSYKVAFQNTSYELPSLSVCFFGKWTDVNITSELILFRMYAETPDNLSISFKPTANDNTTLTLTIVLGEIGTEYTWIVPKTTLQTQSIGTLYTFTYNKDTKKINYYVGNTSLGEKPLSHPVTKPKILLAFSPIEINKTGNWKMELQAVLICRTNIGLDDIKELTEYYSGLANGKVQQIQAAQAAADIASTNNTTCSSKLPKLLAEIENLKGEVNYTQAEMIEMRKKMLRDKVMCAKAAAGKKEFQWLIKNGSCPKIGPTGEGGYIVVPTVASTFKHLIPPLGSTKK